MAAPYRARLKVRFSDIDRAGIVYYPRFLHYFHVAMEEFFAERVGIDYAKVIDERRFGLPTVHLEVDFRRPLRYGDALDVEVRALEIGRTSILWGYRLFRAGEDEPAAEAQIVTVGLDLDKYEKMEIPAWLRERLAE